MTDKDRHKDDAAEAAGGAEDAGTGKGASASARRDSAVPGVRRPPHTIDLQADEVKEENVSGKTSGDKESPPDPSGRASSSSSATGGAGDASGKADAKPDEKTSRRPSGSSAARKEPPQRATRAQVTGFVTHLAAGLLGGVAGVIGAGYFLPHGQDAGGSPQEYRQSVDERFARLDSRLGAVETGAGASRDIETRTAGLEQRLSDAERELEALKAAPAAGERLDRLEAMLKAMEETAAQGGDVAQTAAIRAQIEAITGENNTRIAALRSDLDSLSRKLSELPAGGEAASAEQASRLDALRRDLDALRSEAGSAAEAHARGAAVAVRLAALARAADAGAPFATELEALRAAAPPGADFSALDAWADKGVPSRAELRQRFPQAREAALEAAPPSEGTGSLLDQFLDSASSVIRIRRVDGGGEGGDGPEAILARMRDGLRGGGLEAAVAEAGKLPDRAREALGGWLDQARARIALDAALARASDELARRLARGGASR